MTETEESSQVWKAVLDQVYRPQLKPMKKGGSRSPISKASKFLVFWGERGLGKEQLALLLFQEGKAPKANKKGHFTEVNLKLFPMNVWPEILSGKRFSLRSSDGLFLEEAQVLWQKGRDPGEKKHLKQIFRLLSSAPFSVYLSVNQSLQELAPFLEQKILPKTFAKKVLKNSLQLPSLHEVKEKLPPIIQQFLKDFSQVKALHPPLKIDEDALERMMEYFWPGNWEEFIWVLRHACDRCANGVVKLEHLALPIMVESGEAVFPQRLPRNFGIKIRDGEVGNFHKRPEPLYKSHPEL